jgi:hypothetical protein
LDPVITTFVFCRPWAGEKPELVGDTKKLVAAGKMLLIVLKKPRGERSVRGPVVTPAGA